MKYIENRSGQIKAVNDDLAHKMVDRKEAKIVEAPKKEEKKSEKKDK